MIDDGGGVHIAGYHEKLLIDALEAEPGWLSISSVDRQFYLDDGGATLASWDQPVTADQLAAMGLEPTTDQAELANPEPQDSQTGENR